MDPYWENRVDTVRARIWMSSLLRREKVPKKAISISIFRASRSLGSRIWTNKIRILQGQASLVQRTTF